MTPLMHHQEILHKFNQKEFPEGIALFLDVDGTILEIADDPTLVHVPNDLQKLLYELEKGLGGALAIISGRPISCIDRLFNPIKLPASGKHGIERRDFLGKLHKYRFSDSNTLCDIRRELKAFAKENPGTIVEDKTETIAIHYRLNPSVGRKAKVLIEKLIANQRELEVLIGKMVFEIKPKVVHKGEAIKQFMNEKPFHGKIPIFIGDDISDEDGFQLVNERGGISISVSPKGKSVARWKLKNVSSVISWLKLLIAKTKTTKKCVL